MFDFVKKHWWWMLAIVIILWWFFLRRRPASSVAPGPSPAPDTQTVAPQPAT